MKPISTIVHNSRSFPLIDCNYQPMRLDEFPGRCARIGRPLFQNISRNYFQKEARRDFVCEVFFFAAIVATAVAPLLSAASALTEFCQAIGQL
jgi:hypothetical protein